MNLTNDIIYVGVNDHNIDLFEGQYHVANGMSYNSYVILDDLITIMDSVDLYFGELWIENIKKALNGKKPNYLVISHMEPDHSANIMKLVEIYPDVVLVGNAKTFVFFNQFFPNAKYNSKIVVDGEELVIGKHTLKFTFASMVHWPEVMVTYDILDKVLFTADAFGKFGALDVEEEWINEARRYYIGIVGKYGLMVSNLLKKLKGLDINMIVPLHGPILSSDLNKYISLYEKWSSYQPEDDGVLIAVSSIYGGTLDVAKTLENNLKTLGKKVEVVDLARSDMSESIAKAFKYSKLVCASVTYNGDIFPHMKSFINGLVERGYQQRTVAFIENGTWASQAAKVMKAEFEKCKNITFIEKSIVIKSRLFNESDVKELAELL